MKLNYKITVEDMFTILKYWTMFVNHGNFVEIWGKAEADHFWSKFKHEHNSLWKFRRGLDEENEAKLDEYIAMTILPRAKKYFGLT